MLHLVYNFIINRKMNYQSYKQHIYFLW